MLAVLASLVAAGALAVSGPAPSPSTHPVARAGQEPAPSVPGLPPNLVAMAGLALPAAAPPRAPAAARSSGSPACPGASLRVTFESNPLRRGGPVRLTGPGAGRFSWDERRRALVAHLDSSRPTQRAAAPLGTTVTGADCFRFGATFTIDHLDASAEDFFQLAFGLTASATTGFNRTGTAPAFGDADSFDVVEVSYFPNVTPFGGPFLSPSVFGGPAPFGDAFANFAAVFGPPADLGDNLAPLARALPGSRLLQAEAKYDPGTQLLTLSLIDLSGERPSVLETALVPLDLAFVNGTQTFAADEISVTSWFDAADFDPSTTSLVGRVAYRELFFEGCCDP